MFWLYVLIGWILKTIDRRDVKWQGAAFDTRPTRSFALFGHALKISITDILAIHLGPIKEKN